MSLKVSRKRNTTDVNNVLMMMLAKKMNQQTRVSANLNSCIVCNSILSGIVEGKLCGQGCIVMLNDFLVQLWMI